MVYMVSPNKGELMIRVFKTKNFAKWAKKERITDASLGKVINELNAGLIDADLGGGLLKKRVARKGQGKRSGYRILLAFKNKQRVIFVFGFSKNDRENLDLEEMAIYKKIAAMYLNTPMSVLEKMCFKKQLSEVSHGEK